MKCLTTSDPHRAVAYLETDRPEEIGELPLRLQRKLLRTLQERQVPRVGRTSAAGAPARG